MRSRVSQWGNSLAMRIPASFSREVRIEAGNAVELQVEDGHLVITPVRRTYTLDQISSRPRACWLTIRRISSGEKPWVSMPSM